MSKYLVTGGCGFIGSHLVESLLNDGHKVVVLDNLSTGKLSNIDADKCEMHIGDILNEQLVIDLMNQVDGCFHLAAVASVEQSNIEWQKTHQINLSASINVFNAARANKIRNRAIPVVYASSAAVYGDNIETPLNESSIAHPLTAYGADKLGSEQHARVAHLVHGVPTTGLRFFNVYGPRQDPNSPYSGVISIFANRIIKNQDINIFGDGSQTRDFVYVKDVVRFLRASMIKNNGHHYVYNVCTGKAASVNQIALNLIRLCKSKSQIHYQKARSGDIKTSSGNPEKANIALDTVANTKLYDGLNELLSWFSQETAKQEQHFQ